MTDNDIRGWLTNRCNELATQLSTDLIPNLAELRKGYEDTIRSLTESYKASVDELESRNSATVADCRAALNSMKTEYEEKLVATIAQTDAVVVAITAELTKAQAERDAANISVSAAIAAKQSAETITAQTLSKFDPEIKAAAQAERFKRAEQHREKANRLEAGEDVL